MSDSREEHLHEETSQVASFAPLQQELAVFQREIMFPQDPALEVLATKRVALKEAIQNADHHREDFMQQSKQLPRGAYLRQEKLLREDLAVQQKLAVELAQLQRAWISEKIKSLDTQYWQYKNDILPKIKNPKEQQLLLVFLQKVSQLKQVAEHMLVESYVFQDFIKLMENKKYQRYWELVKLDPWDRYDKEAREKAKRYATQGPARDVKYALQYLGGGPVTQADKGKCAITDEHIDRDEETMNNLVSKAKEKAKNAKQQEFIVWTQQSSQEVPSSMDPLRQLGENYTLLEQELREKGFATDYLVQSTKK